MMHMQIINFLVTKPLLLPFSECIWVIHKSAATRWVWCRDREEIVEAPVRWNERLDYLLLLLSQSTAKCTVILQYHEASLWKVWLLLVFCFACCFCSWMWDRLELVFCNVCFSFKHLEDDWLFMQMYRVIFIFVHLYWLIYTHTNTLFFWTPT